MTRSVPTRRSSDLDFCGGLATRRAAAAAVVLWSHVLGLALLFGGALLLSGHADGGDLVAGAVGGLVGAAGIGRLYRALALGTMSIGAPTPGLQKGKGAGRGRRGQDSMSEGGQITLKKKTKERP